MRSNLSRLHSNRTFTMGKRKQSAPVRATEAKRSALTWNMLDGEPGGAVSVIPDNDPSLQQEAAMAAGSQNSNFENRTNFNGFIWICTVIFARPSFIHVNFGRSPGIITKTLTPFTETSPLKIASRVKFDDDDVFEHFANFRKFDNPMCIGLS